MSFIVQINLKFTLHGKCRPFHQHVSSPKPVHQHMRRIHQCLMPVHQSLYVSLPTSKIIVITNHQRNKTLLLMYSCVFVGLYCLKLFVSLLPNLSLTHSNKVKQCLLYNWWLIVFDKNFENHPQLLPSRV